MTTTAASASQSVDVFDELAALMQAHRTRVLAQHGPHLFVVEPAQDLYELYLANLPDEWRQHHSCHSCKHFLQRYGNLAVIDDAGNIVPAMWPESDHVPALYAASVLALRRAVAAGNVTGVFLSAAPVWGTPVTGTWTHMAVTPPPAAVYRPTVLSAGQAMAKKHEDYLDLGRGLREFPRLVVAQAVTLLEAEALYRSEKVLGPAKFLLGLHDLQHTHHGRQRDHLLWRAVAAAPPGFCQPRSSMIGTLLTDIAEGQDFSEVRRRFAAKMRPDQYQRPQAAPAAGTIAQAEKLVAMLGIEPALHRRFATLDEVLTIWKPAPVAPPAAVGGVFGHLQPKGAPTTAPLAMPAQQITWVKFERTVLPSARQIEVFMRPVGNFCAIVTASNADAPPILQWDTEAQRNPFSWYVYMSGSTPAQWGLALGSWVPVTGVTLQPSLWYGREPGHQGTSAVLILEGAVDTKASGLALFPEILRAELHGVRAVIEAHSASRNLEGADHASACGLRVGQGRDEIPIRVTTATGVAVYSIDRWD